MSVSLIPLAPDLILSIYLLVHQNTQCFNLMLGGLFGFSGSPGPRPPALLAACPLALSTRGSLIHFAQLAGPLSLSLTVRCVGPLGIGQCLQAAGLQHGKGRVRAESWMAPSWWRSGGIRDTTTGSDRTETEAEAICICHILWSREQSLAE